MKKVIDSSELAKRFDALLKEKPASWMDEGWDAYKDGVQVIVQSVAPYYGDLNPRRLLKLSWNVEEVADQWREGAITHNERGFDYDATLDCYRARGADDVKEILIDTLDKCLAQLEE